MDWERLGTPERAEGNRPLALDSPAEVRVVLEGTVDLFLLDGSGRRHHLLRAGPGQLVGGVAGSPEARWLGVGTPGTRLARLALADLLAREGAAELLDGWLSALAASAPGELPPRGGRVLAEGALRLEAGTVAHVPAGRPPLWVGPGGFRVRGAETDPETLFPLAGRLWLSAPAAVDLQPLPTRARLADPRLPRDLEAFHRWALVRQVEASRGEQQRRVQRLAHLQEAEERSVGEAVLALGSVLSQEADVAAAAARPALLEAFRRVARASGLRFPPDREDLLVDGDPARSLERLARAGRFRYRRVQLAGRWWREDCGPLLAFRRDGSPVALLREGSRYWRVDPGRGTRDALTPQVASDLQEGAWSLYRPLPARPLAFGDLVAFGLARSGPDLARLLLALVLGALLSTAIPVGTGLLFARIIPAGRSGELVELSLGLAVAVLAATLFNAVQGFAVLRQQGRVDGFLEAALWDRILELPLPFFRRFSAGELADRAVGVGVLREVLGGMVATAALGAVVSLGNVALMLLVSPALGLAALLLAGPPVVGMAFAGRAMLRLNRQIFDLQGQLSGLVLQLLTGIAKLRAAGAESRAFALWARRFARQRRLAWHVRRILNRTVAGATAWPAFCAAVIFAALGAGAADLETGTFLAFQAAFGSFMAALMALGPATAAVLAMVPRFERARPILEATPEVAAGRADPGELSGRIEVSRVTFRYSPESPAVLQDVSLRVEPGEFVAVVGPSGSGKSTLIRLLLGFEAPESGAVYYDGVDLAHLDARAVRRQIGVVLQSSGLMAGTIQTNIVGTSAATSAEAWEAARRAGIDDYLRELPMGMQTRVGEGAETFSGGQRQRLLIARALVSRPRIVLFDEATSALDNPAQEVVSQSLRELRATRLVIAHRLSTIRHADRIVVIEEGRIVQEGTYEELLDQPGPFRDQARRQLAHG